MFKRKIQKMANFTLKLGIEGEISTHAIIKYSFTNGLLVKKKVIILLAFYSNCSDCSGNYN